MRVFVKSPLICCIANLFYQFVRRLSNSKQRETRFQATFDAIKGCGFDTSFMKDAKYTYEYKGIACLLVTLRREIAQKCTNNFWHCFTETSCPLRKKRTMRIMSTRNSNNNRNTIDRLRARYKQ